ncbi:Carbohydrate binding module family 20 [Micractinium conductrix]|uniref:Carbohydrate binding module family 20 n=1 Tax=Micractinium conductrix TaxID=554055 RepID=A0A2P6VCR4_9CHLO|nr:Carbohydrate binding module family 20 [Micractinium conductrix]|eukprot:PSC71872.1 Carbohydrate binding module family 20 [Micractinium conductrix]
MSKALRQPTCTLASRQVHGVRLPIPAFAAGARISVAQRRQERHDRANKCQAVYTADRKVHRRTPSYDGPTARVTFKAPRALPFGQVLKLVGSHHELGEWELTDAPVMTWSEGDVWLLAADLPAGEHEFKIAAVAVGTNGEETVVEWEQGPNRVLQVPTAEAKINGSFSVLLEWGNPVAAARDGQLLAGSNWQQQNGNDHHHNGHGHHNGSRHEWSIEDERNARRAAEAERDSLRGERDSLAHQLVHAQDSLASALAEKAQLEAAAQRAQHNIDVLRQVGQLLRTMHTD